MDNNNQYFFSNEEGSNDSNVNMIGGSDMMAPRSAEMHQKMLSAAANKATKGGPMSVGDELRLKRAMKKTPGGKGGSGGTGEPGGNNNAPVSLTTAAKVADMPTISSKQSSSSTEKGSNCKEEKQKLNKLLIEKQKLENDYIELTGKHNTLINILTTYETQFKDFNTQKKKFDTTLKILEQILTTEDAQILKQEAETLIEKAAQKKSESGVGEGTSGETQQQPPTDGPPPQLSPSTAGPLPPQVLVGKAQPPPPPNAEQAQPPTPPQPNAGQTQQTNNSESPSVVETSAEPQQSSPNTDPVLEEKKQVFSKLFTDLVKLIENNNYEKKQVNDAIIKIQTALDTLHAVNKGVNAVSGMRYSVVKTFLGSPIEIIASNKVLGNYFNNIKTKKAAQKMIKEKNKAIRDNKVKIFVKSFIIEEKRKTIEGLEEIFPDESPGEGDDCKTSKTDPKGNCGKNLICKKKGKRPFGKATCVKDENAETTDESIQKADKSSTTSQEAVGNTNTTAEQDQSSQTQYPNSTTAQESAKNLNAVGGSRRKKKTKRRRGRRSQKGSGRRKKSLKRSKTN